MTLAVPLERNILYHAYARMSTPVLGNIRRRSRHEPVVQGECRRAISEAAARCGSRRVRLRRNALRGQLPFQARYRQPHAPLCNQRCIACKCGQGVGTSGMRNSIAGMLRTARICAKYSASQMNSGPLRGAPRKTAEECVAGATAVPSALSPSACATVQPALHCLQVRPGRMLIGRAQ